MRAERLGRRSARRPALDPEARRRRRPSSLRERVAEPADRRRDPRGRRRARTDRASRSQSSVEAIQPRHVHDPKAEASLGEELGRRERLVQHHRPVREENRVARRRAPCVPIRPGAVLRARSAAATARSRAGLRRSPPRPRPPSAGALASPRRSPAGRPSCRAAQRAARCPARDWCDFPGPAGIKPCVVERIDDLRPLARLVVDLLVRP